MSHQSFFYCLLLAISLFSGCDPQVAPVKAPAQTPALVQTLGVGLSMEIDPRIELLAGVQSQTSWTTDPHSDGYWSPASTGYFAQLRGAFGAFQQDPAVVLSQNLLQYHGFSYDAPPAFALSGEGGLAFEPPVEGYSQYLIGRAGGPERLKTWAAALRNLAVSSDFDSFFRSHLSYYEGLLAKASQGLDAAPLAQWLKDYYGSKGDYVFHFVLAPAMLPPGGYGCTVVRSETGRAVKHIYQVIRAAESVSGGMLVGLTLHEFGHSFVNPAIGEQLKAEQKEPLARIFAPVEAVMAKLAYPELATFLNELVLRAATIRGQRALNMISEVGVELALGAEAQAGFYPVRMVYQELIDYEAHRDRWPNFQDFGPELLSRLTQKSDAILATYRSGPTTVDAIKADFEGPGPAPGPPFELFEGATSNGKGGDSQIFLDSRAPARGKACLTFKGGENISNWPFVGVKLNPKKGKLVAQFQVRAKGLGKEGSQFENGYAGFLVEAPDGSKSAQVRSFAGSFDWKHESVELEVDPARVKSLRFGLFLSMSGELSFDEVSVDWN